MLSKKTKKIFTRNPRETAPIYIPNRDILRDIQKWCSEFEIRPELIPEVFTEHAHLSLPITIDDTTCDCFYASSTWKKGDKVCVQLSRDCDVPTIQIFFENSSSICLNGFQRPSGEWEFMKKS
jgi:hypothetical protein